MKKVNRMALCLLLTIAMCLSLIPGVGAEEPFEASISAKALTDGAQLYCVAQIEKVSASGGDVSIFKVVYNENDEVARAEKEKISFSDDANDAVTKEITVDYNSGKNEYAVIYFWKGDTLEPVHSPVNSKFVPEGSLEEEKIEITQNMVFASSEAEFRATKVVDGDLESYWSAKGVTRDNPQSVTAALEYEYTITKVGIAFGLGSERQYVFTVETSTDGMNYTTALGETVSEFTDEMQYFEVPMSIGSFVRVKVIERVVPDNDNWIRINEIEAYGMLVPYDTGDEVELYSFDFEKGTRLPEEGDDVDGWIVSDMNERSMAYTQSLGEKLYAEVGYLPQQAAMGTSESALHLYDAVGRDTDAVNGAGGVMAAKRYQTNEDRGRYKISFNMFIPSQNADGEKLDTYWSGFSITDEMVSGGNDLSHYAAIQIRMEDSGEGVKLRRLISNYYNEGSLIDFMGTTFKKDCLWTVEMEVDPKARQVQMTVSDGTNTETKTTYFSYNDAEYCRISTWSGLEAKYLIFNTGAGKKSELYVDDVKVTHYAHEEESSYKKSLGKAEISEESVTYKNIADDKGESDYTGSLGEKLYAEVCEAPANSGIEGNVLHVFDEVGRETDEINGAGGVMGYISLPVPENKMSKYRIDFKLYAPVADEYGGFSLSNGIDGSYGMQLRFKPSNADENNLMLKQYAGNTFNGGNYEDVVGGYTPLTKGNTWDISVEVDMLSFTYTLTIDDGVNSQTREKSIPTTYESWADKNLDTLAINSGIGGNADIYVGDISVTDLGCDYAVKSALHGIFRLVASHGTGNMLHHQGNEVSDFAEKQDPEYTRFVERSGLMDPEGVSFEVMNRPGYFLTIVPGTDNKVQVQPYSETARFKANATFYKQNGGKDPLNYGKSTVAYASYRDPSRYFYNNSGDTVVWKRHSVERTIFYQRNEATHSRVSDNFNGTSLDTGKWLAQYPWGDSHNHYGLCDKSAIEVKNGNITLKANKIGDNSWPVSKSGKNKGKNGIDLSSFGFGGWKKWQAYVGVISPHKNYNGYDGSVKYWSQSYMEGTFKQPNCGYGYWTAFWLSGADAWPPETDIFEYLSSSGSGAHSWYTNMHYSNSVSDGNWYQGSNLRTTYHRYALDWGYNYMDMYYDGVLYRRYTGYIPDFQDDKGGMCLVINTGIGGWESSLPSEYGIGLSMEWFRSFQY